MMSAAWGAGHQRPGLRSGKLERELRPPSSVPQRARQAVGANDCSSINSRSSSCQRCMVWLHLTTVPNHQTVLSVL